MTVAVTTEDQILAEARRLIMSRGFNGFSYADVAEVVGVRKASIHYYFPGKGDLAKAVVEQSHAVIRTQIEALSEGEPDARERLQAYAGYWERCIRDQSAPFCVAGMLAAELPSLPEDLAEAVRVYFSDLKRWLTGLLALGVRQGSVSLSGTPEEEADAFMSAVYGAMLSARAFADPDRFATITRTLLSRVVALH